MNQAQNQVQQISSTFWWTSVTMRKYCNNIFKRQLSKPKKQYFIETFTWINVRFSMKLTFVYCSYWPYMYIISYTDYWQCIWAHIHGLCSYDPEALVYIRWCCVFFHVAIYHGCWSTLLHNYAWRHFTIRRVEITFDPRQMAKETDEVVIVQIYVQHQYTQIRPVGFGRN